MPLELSNEQQNTKTSVPLTLMNLQISKTITSSSIPFKCEEALDQFVDERHKSERYIQTNVQSIAYATSQGVGTLIHSRLFLLNDIFKLLLQDPSESYKRYAFFTSELRVSIEIKSTALMQGLLAFGLVSPYVNDDYSPHLMTQYEIATANIDSSGLRRLFYQDPVLVDVSRTQNFEVDIPVYFQLDKIPTDFAWPNFRLARLNIHALTPLLSNSTITQVPIKMVTRLANLKYFNPVEK